MNLAYESCFDAMSGTPTKRTSKALQPSSAARADRFIPQRSAMDLDVSNMNLNNAENQNGNGNHVNASPAKEECTPRPPPLPARPKAAPPELFFSQVLRAPEPGG